MIKQNSFLGILILGISLLSSACTEEAVYDIGLSKKGDSCKQVSDCKPGLTCKSNKCTPVKDSIEGTSIGDPCSSDKQCEEPLICGRNAETEGFCIGEGRGEGKSCAVSFDCGTQDNHNLVCSSDKFCVPEGSPNTKGLEDECVLVNNECRAALICLNNQCQKVPIFTGVDCNPDETGEFRVYYERPPENPSGVIEFFKLPFPNDLRIRADGTLNLEGYPASEYVLDILVKPVDEDFKGFALNQPVLFRFKDNVDKSTLCLDDESLYPKLPKNTDEEFCTSNGAATVKLVNLDTNTKIPVQMAVFDDSQGKDIFGNPRIGDLYICQNWVGLAPLDGRPLDPNTSYAAIITTGVKDQNGNEPVKDTYFAELMDGNIGDVPAFDPFLKWLDTNSINKSTVAAAAVFTTGSPTTVAGSISNAVSSAEIPVYKDVFNCADLDSESDDSANWPPCQLFQKGLKEGNEIFDKLPNDSDLKAQMRRRYCHEENNEYDEYQGKFSNPVFQQGQRPYSTIADKNGAFVSHEAPVVQAYEDICFALTVPKNQGNGPFPVIIYAHGTNGWYSHFIHQGIAEDLAKKGYAVFGFDNVMHGPRQRPVGEDPRADSNFLKWLPPSMKFFTLDNPRASRDNVLQGSADLFNIVKLLATIDFPAGSFNLAKDQIYFLGHSQGTVIAPAFMKEVQNFSTGLNVGASVPAVVLSGSGSDLLLSMLYKEEPPEVSKATTLFFGDEMQKIHPLMIIMAIMFSSSDGLAFAPEWSTLPILHFSGIDDTYTPDVTQYAQLRAADMPFVGEVEEEVWGIKTVNSPYSESPTQGAVQLKLSGEDSNGHFVLFEHPDASGILEHFLDTAQNGSPEIQH